jgi:O-glycosyl hydrolase
MNNPSHLIIASLLLLGSWNTEVFGQVECTGQGNLRGIRVDGELMAFSTSIRAVGPTAADQGQGGRGGGGGRFSRDGETLTVTGNLTGGGGRGGGFGGGFGGGRGRGGAPTAGASCRAVFKDASPGTVDAEIQITATTNIAMEGVFFAITLPDADYAGGSAQWISPTSGTEASLSLAKSRSATTNFNLHASAKGVRLTAARRQIELNFPAPAELIIRDVHNRDTSSIEISFPVSLGVLTNGQSVHAAFAIKATGEVDKSPANVAIDLSKPGRRYDGMGGNFRIQSPNDAAQIQYNLENLRVAWGRVAIPLDRWQPDENSDPASVTTNALNPNVRDAMEMAQKLARRNIPFVASIWSVPSWAVATNSEGRGERAPLPSEKRDQVAKSIAAYLEYMKQNYGAEAALFSFNESDMGINVFETPENHADTIKRFGAYFASRGLKTKMLLGDTGNPTGGWFIDVAAADLEAAKNVGAVSFHSWNSGTVEQYTHFSSAARRLNVPLLVGEGGLDPAAHQYRAIFLEPWFCLNEIAQYVEICRVAQPLSILHWQLTYDYSVLQGGTGGQPLQPAQRFWQIKQLGMTAPDSVAVTITCDNPKVTSCAFADHGTPVVHLVNNGAPRTATVSGLPAGVKEMRVFVTDSRQGMKETGRVSVAQGTVQLPLAAMSFTSLMGNP